MSPRWRGLLPEDDPGAGSPVPEILRALTRALNILDKHAAASRYGPLLLPHAPGPLTVALAEALEAATQSALSHDFLERD